jgi:hypothetical protein
MYGAFVEADSDDSGYWHSDSGSETDQGTLQNLASHLSYSVRRRAEDKDYDLPTF